MVGQLYRLTDIRRDAAYTIFYMGINAGAALRGDPRRLPRPDARLGLWFRPRRHRHAWRASWCSCSARSALRGAGEPPVPLGKAKEFTLYGIGLAAVAVMWALVQYSRRDPDAADRLGRRAARLRALQAFKLPKEPRERMFAILFLIALNPLFWGLFEQAGGSLNLYTDRFVDRGDVPASLFQSINSIYIILFAPVFAAAWALLGQEQGSSLRPRPSSRLALLQIGLGSFLVFVWGANTVGAAAHDPGDLRVPDLPAARRPASCACRRSASRR